MGGPVENLLRAAGCPLYAVPKALGFDVEAQRSAAQVEADNARGCVAPCWDETDNGIPDVCLERKWCPFNPDNPVTNDNFVCLVFGNIGFPYFDRRRKVYMGVAMWSTLLAMFVTAFGALSLSTDPDVVRTSYWAKLETWNATSRETTHYYLGLRSIVTVYDGGDETTDRLEIDYMVGRIPGSRNVDPMREELLESCADSAAGNQIGALLSCVTLIFALLGTINRMKFSSDANVQKALGLVTDTWGALTLSYTLFNFHANCFDDLPNRFLHLDLDYEWGPGWICYLFCALSGLPMEILKLLDADGDGEITWEDQKLMFRNLKKFIQHETVEVRSRATILRADMLKGGGRFVRAASDAAEDLADRVRHSLTAHDESPRALGDDEARPRRGRARGLWRRGARAAGAGDGDVARVAGASPKAPGARGASGAASPPAAGPRQRASATARPRTPSRGASVLRESTAHDRHERLAKRSAERSAARRGSVRTANVPTYLYGLSDDARCSPRLLEEDEARRHHRPKAMWNKVRLNMKHLKQAQVRPDDGAGAADAAPEADPDPVTAQPAPSPHAPPRRLAGGDDPGPLRQGRLPPLADRRDLPPLRPRDDEMKSP
ncbi:endonuclease [Aureococcus anophagefferens]|nr:endonuclease [Aureococcus anophagefferens]